MNKGRAQPFGLAVICLAYATAAIVFNIAPILIGSLIDGLALSETKAGLIVTIDMMAMAVTGFALGPFLASSNRRLLLFAGAALLLAGNVASPIVSDDVSLIVSRLTAGIGAGLLFVYANTRAAMSADPVRTYGLTTMSATILGAVLLFSTPIATTSAGLIGLFGLLGVIAAGLAVVAFREPTEPLGILGGGQAGARLSVPMLTLLSAGIMLIALVQSAYYSFAERAGVDVGLSPTTVGSILAVGYLGGIASSALAAWVSVRWGRWPPLALAIGLQALCAILVLNSDNPEVVRAGLFGQSLTLFFGIPYLLGLNAEADSSGRFANIGAGLFFFSLAAGPFVGGVILERFGYKGIAWTVAAGTLLGLVALIPVARDIRSIVEKDEGAQSSV